VKRIIFVTERSIENGSLRLVCHFNHFDISRNSISQFDIEKFESQLVMIVAMILQLYSIIRVFLTLYFKLIFMYNEVFAIFRLVFLLIVFIMFKVNMK